MAFSLHAYRLISRLAAPLLPLYLRRRVKSGKEDAARISERYGRTDKTQPNSDLIWMHAASVGESVMLMPLINALLKDDTALNILITTGTVTSAQMMEARLPARALHQYLPADTPRAVKRFLDHWRPNAALWAESEIWPNLVTQTKARHIPMALINARMSDKTLKGWSKRKAMARKLLSCFDHILPADQRTASGLSDLLGRDMELTGNLKYAAPPLPIDLTKLAGYRAVLGMRPIWCAASTHKGEDEIILNALKAILKTRPNALLILVPRPPERGPVVNRLITAQSLNLTQSTFPEEISSDTDVLLIAALGQLGLAYRLAPVSFIGGSLLPELSGHNPLEPARLSSAILSGPYIDSFADIFTPLFENGAARKASSAEQITSAVLELWDSAPICEAQVSAAKHIAASQDQVLSEVTDTVKGLLPSA